MDYTIVSRANIVFLLSNTTKISLQNAIDRKMFGPVYHGSSETARQSIKDNGFKIFVGQERSNNISHGYEISNYFNNMPAPIHHLGFGVYFTTVKNIAKQYNHNTTRGLKTYYLDVPRLETINFGSSKNMMNWWNKNGYNVTPNKYDAEERLSETINLTKHLDAKYDAVWFKGKGLHRLLDGDQIVVFNPENIYEIDNTLSQPFEIGSKVRRKTDGMIGIILRKEDLANFSIEKFPGMTWLKDGSKFRFAVKWRKGGIDYNVLDVDIESF